MAVKTVEKRAPAGPTPTEAQIASILADINAGLALPDCCAGAGVDSTTFLRGLSAGGAAKSGQWREIRARVVAAQVESRRAALAILAAQASRGAPAALGALIDRLSQPDEALDPPPTERRAFLRYRLADIQGRMGRAAGIAYHQLVRHEAALLSELATVEAESGRGSLDKATPEERLVYDEQDAAACTLDDLEVYVLEWCRRQKLRLDIIDGAPVLSRDAASIS